MADDKVRLERIRQQTTQKLVESGEKDRLKELLRQKLDESGWREDLTVQCKELIKKKGAEKVTVDDLVPELTAYGRQRVPDEVKKELLSQIRAYLQSQTSTN